MKDQESDLFAGIIAKNVRKLREKKRLTQIELARLIGGSHSYVHSIESHEKLPSFVMGMRIARVLEVKPEDLLKK